MRRLLIKESIVALVVAVVLAGIAFLRVYIEFPLEIMAAATIALSLFIMVLLSVAMGIGFAVLLDKLKMDPAAGAVPMVASAADILGICVLVGLSAGMMAEKVVPAT